MDSNEFCKNRPAKGVDLFSEIHGDMPERLAELETKNDQLALKLKETEKDVTYVIPVLKRLEVMSTPGQIYHSSSHFRFKNIQEFVDDKFYVIF